MTQVWGRTGALGQAQVWSVVVQGSFWLANQNCAVEVAPLEEDEE